MLNASNAPGGRPAVARDGDVILFGEFRLAPASRALTRDGSPVHLGSRALDILIALVERAWQIVSKAELFAIAWPGKFVEDSNLRVQIAALRQALGDGRDGARFIVGVPGRGYTFVADVERMAGGGGVAEPVGSAAQNDLPVPLVGIVGRDEIVSDIAGQLQRRRFVTITGPGGVGKTAVALTIAGKLASSFRDGVRLVALGSVSHPDLAVTQLASLLRLPAPDKQQVQNIVAHLRTRNMMIVFDDCDHVVEAVSEIAEAILQGAPEIQMLATSRETLRAAGETVHRLAPLTVPPVSPKLTAAEMLRYPAAQLFVERVHACDATCEITDANASSVAEICTRLDGLSLAIELAAARAPLFGVCGLVGRLDDRFSILTKARRTALPRHQSLAATIDWSYEPLSDEEKIVWCRFGVFPDFFTIEDAAAIGNDRPNRNFNIVDILDSLVGKSLVAVVSRAGETRYRLLESLQLYARGKLVEHKDEQRVMRRFVQYR
jgi:predicted ATPase/DNA-binding winged helix-turn-helix (wHTH) protein